MKVWRQLFCLVLLIISFHGCAHLDEMTVQDAGAKAEIDRQKMVQDNELYAPYRERNTLEGYREFIRKHPDNMNVDEARLAMARLELPDCYDADCLKAFIAEYPLSSLNDEAKSRLKAIEDKNLEKETAVSYGVDFSYCRLNLKRIRKDLIDMNKAHLAAFSDSLSIAKHGGKTYLCTRLTFDNSLFLPEFSLDQKREELFDFIIAPQLEYLMIKFKKKKKIDGFRFSIIGLDHVELYFPTDQVDRFINGDLQKDVLLKSARQIPPAEVVPPIDVVQTGKAGEPTTAKIPGVTTKQPDATASGRTAKPVAMSFVPTIEKVTVSGQYAEIALPLMPLGPAENHVIRGGRYVHRGLPVFTLSYPSTWIAEKKTARVVLSAGTDGGLPAVEVMTARITNDAGLFLESVGMSYVKMLKQRGATGVDLVYNAATAAYENHQAVEFEIRFKQPHKMGGAVRTLYGQAIAEGGYAVILAGETLADIDPLKELFETIEFKKNR